MPEDVARQIAVAVRAELDKTATVAMLGAGGGQVKAAAPKVPAPEVLEIEDKLLKEESVLRKVAKAKQHVKLKTDLEWLGLIDPWGTGVIC